MLKNDEQNSFTVLAKSVIKKDIDQNFIETLQALIFLNSNSDLRSLLAERVEIKEVERLIISDSLYSELKNTSNVKIEKEESARFFQDSDLDSYDSYITPKKFNYGSYSERSYSYHYNNETYKIATQKNLGEVLLDKLHENLRRLYAANRKGKNRLKNIDSLLEQQKYIYEGLEILKPYFKFDNEKRIFTKLFLGNVKYCSNFEAFYYLSFHEHILKDNEKKHLNILNSMFENNGLSVDNVLKELLMLSYADNKKDMVEEAIKLFPIEKINNLKLLKGCEEGLRRGRFSLELFLHCAQNNIELEDNVKKFYFKQIFNSFCYLSKYKSIEATELANIFKSYLPELDIKNDVERFINLGKVGKDTVVDVALELTDKLTDVNLLLISLDNEDTYVTPEQRERVLQKFDFKDKALLIKAIDTISVLGDRSKQNKMNIFANKISNTITPEIVSYILAKDFSFMKIMKPIYMNMKLRMQFEQKDKDDIHPTKKVNRLKL